MVPEHTAQPSLNAAALVGRSRAPLHTLYICTSFHLGTLHITVIVAISYEELTIHCKVVSQNNTPPVHPSISSPLITFWGQTGPPYLLCLASVWALAIPRTASLPQETNYVSTCGALSLSKTFIQRNGPEHKLYIRCLVQGRSSTL